METIFKILNLMCSCVIFSWFRTWLFVIIFSEWIEIVDNNWKAHLPKPKRKNVLLLSLLVCYENTDYLPTYIWNPVS